MLRGGECDDAVHGFDVCKEPKSAAVRFDLDLGVRPSGRRTVWLVLHDLRLESGHAGECAESVVQEPCVVDSWGGLGSHGSLTCSGHLVCSRYVNERFD